VNINNLAAEYQRRFAGQKAVYVRCDKQTIFDPLAQVISALGEAKLDVRLVTQPDDAGAK
jgi:biopolymer transport protein ExbD